MRYLRMAIASVPLMPTDLVVSVHACGSLTDLVLERAISARVAVRACCHDLGRCDTGGLDGWMAPWPYMQHARPAFAMPDTRCSHRDTGRDTG